MKLVVNKDSFKRFLDLLTLFGENQIKEGLLNIQKDKISSLVKSPTNTIGIGVSLKGKFEDIGEIGIDDLALFENSLNIQSKDDVSFEVKDNKIIISSGKIKSSLVLRKSDYIKNKPKEEDFKKHVDTASGNEFLLTKENISTLMEAFNLIKSDTVVITGNSKSVKFTFNRLDNEIETSIDLKKEIKEFRTTVSSTFLFLLNLIKEDLIVSIKKDVPAILINHKNSEIEVNYIVAPYGK
uniref:DNA polymerase n=1 Tax=viral metagenome TaxID=1070528 RepID=A0A6M3JS17_9ZZZZ